MSQTHLHLQVKRPYLQVLTLNTKYTIHVEIKTFSDGMRKGPTNIVKCQGSRYVLTRSKSHKNGLRSRNRSLLGDQMFDPFLPSATDEST